MKRLCVICEGPTEVEFVKNCLEPYLRPQGLHTYPSLLQAPSGNHRGGRVTVERLGKHLAHEYDRTDRITTLVDYYGFRDAGGSSRAQLEADILAETLKWNPRADKRFILPYVQMYEFEGLLFSDIEQFHYVLDGWNKEARTQLLAIRNAFETPEKINNSKETAPSKRILKIFGEQAYSKTEHGPIIAEEIGLEKIRLQCAQFDEWIKKLEVW